MLFRYFHSEYGDGKPSTCIAQAILVHGVVPLQVLMIPYSRRKTEDDKELLQHTALSIYKSG